MSIPELVSAVVDDNKIEAENMFKNVISKKVGDAIELKRVQTANQLVTNHVPEVTGADEEGV